MHVGRDPDPWRNRLGRWRRGTTAWRGGPLRLPRTSAAAVSAARRGAVPRRGLRREPRSAVRVAPRHLREFRRRRTGDQRDRTCLVGAPAGVLRSRPKSQCSCTMALHRRGEATRLSCGSPSTSTLGFAHCGARPPSTTRAGELCSDSGESGRERSVARDRYVSSEFRRRSRVHARRALCRPAVSSPLRLERRDAPGAGGRPPVLVPDRGLMAWRTRHVRPGSHVCGGVLRGPAPGDAVASCPRRRPPTPPASAASCASSAASAWRPRCGTRSISAGPPAPTPYASLRPRAGTHEDAPAAVSARRRGLLRLAVHEEPDLSARHPVSAVLQAIGVLRGHLRPFWIPGRLSTVDGHDALAHRRVGRLHRLAASLTTAGRGGAHASLRAQAAPGGTAADRARRRGGAERSRDGRPPRRSELRHRRGVGPRLHAAGLLAGARHRVPLGARPR